MVGYTVSQETGISLCVKFLFSFDDTNVQHGEQRLLLGSGTALKEIGSLSKL